MRLGLLPALLGAIFGLALAPQASAKGWLRAESEHFVLYSNFGEGPTRDYLRQLEAFNYLTGLALGVDPKTSSGSVAARTP